MKFHLIILALVWSVGAVWAQDSDAQTQTNIALATPPAPSQWVWSKAEARGSVPPGETVYFRKTFELPAFVDEAFVFVTADNEYTLFVNGTEAGRDDDWEVPDIIDIREFLLTGKNVIAVEARNGLLLGMDRPSPAGLFLYACIRQKDSDQFKPILDFATDKSWLCSTNAVKGWEKTDFKPQNWVEAVELGDLTVAPWNTRGVDQKLTEALSQVKE